eukprot:6174333-Pleurochrysis_carterae.AAC.1
MRFKARAAVLRFRGAPTCIVRRIAAHALRSQSHFVRLKCDRRCVLAQDVATVFGCFRENALSVARGDHVGTNGQLTDVNY